MSTDEKRWLLWFLPVFTLTCACHHSDLEGDAVLLDGASDEVLVSLQDSVARGEVTVDDDRTAHLVTPADGAQLSLDAPPEFAWEPPAVNFVHGRATGDFTWLRIRCGDMVPIDVLGIETRSWTPDSEHWDKIGAAGQTCSSTLTSAFVDRGIIMEGGPFQPAMAPTFSVLAGPQ